MKGIFFDLIKPNLELENEFTTFYKECLESDDKVSGDGGFSNFTTYLEWLNYLTLMESKDTVPDGYVPSYTYVLYNYIHEEIIGIINIRTTLNDFLFKRGGNIGYSIRPKYRQKGNGKLLLRLAINLCRDLNMNKLLITCNSDNIASQKLISSSGGVLDILEKNYQRYWITL